MHLKKRIAVRLIASVLLTFLAYAAPTLATDCPTCLLDCQAQNEACWQACPESPLQARTQCRRQCSLEYQICGDECLIFCSV